MKLGIMQPYFFPYIGYWQLMNAVDLYVVYDDVNYIKGGWINRNRIINNNQICYFNVILKESSPNKLINQIEINNDARLIAKNERILAASYKKAPYFDDVFPMIEQILSNETSNLAEYLLYSLRTVSHYLDIETEIVLSSSIHKNCKLKGQDKVLELCELMGATEYFNAIGGRELYSFEDFAERKIQLKFLETGDVCYKQWDAPFVPNLSIIDVLMFNEKKIIKEFLNEYKMIERLDY